MPVLRDGTQWFVAAVVFSALGCFAGSTNEPAWWSLKPIKRPAVPVSNAGLAPRNPIDLFIAAELRKNGLVPSRETDRRTLLRRVYFDLTGLPPSPEELAAFEKNKSPRAYEEVVEKLLASPRHGERWARHWLDTVRFAESNGFEMNQPRPNAWPYRDYVIRSFNENKPFDQFVVEQLAGDVFGVDEATGFLVGGPWDQVKSPDPVLTANQRVDELHDMVGVTGSTFLGLTVGCARCHNHKFDPIPQKDYFAMKAVFEGVRHGERPLRTAEMEVNKNELAAKKSRLAAIETELENFEPLAIPTSTNAVRASVNARRNVDRFASVKAKRLRFTIARTTDAEPCLDELEVYTTEPAPRNIALATNGTKASASSVYPNSEIHRVEHINDGRHGNGRSWISNEGGKGWVELEFPELVTIAKVVWGRDREQHFVDRLALDYKIEVAAGANDWSVVASSSDRQTFEAGKKSDSKLNLAALSSNAAAMKLLEERAELEPRIAKLARGIMVYAGTLDANPEATYLLYRGEATQKRDEVKPNALSAIPVAFAINTNQSGAAKISKALTEDQQRRLALAQWMVNPTNPLTARVMVNRIWQFHFGEGLVGTPSDFGANGARPVHPELLDWLASEFMDRGWSIKDIHRLIVNSATYRQASATRKECIALDANTKLLWRFPPRRSDAEVIRDSILAVSGKLDLTMGGPGFSFFETNDNYVRVYTPRHEWSPDTFRRMVYGTIVRQRTDGVFGVFDCPDAGQIAPKRSTSTTPLQALNLLNSSFIMQQAGFFAARLQKEAGDDSIAQIRRAFALTFQREPERKEIAASKKFIRDEGLSMFCRAMLNANEFIYVF
ncbi:MAG: DUF1549 and DUF1553 domain-containing protein [Verrucomicrobiota bacterium]